MTLGERIAYLRTSKNISQEQLAEDLGISRQSVSKWEVDGAVPQVDKLLQLCEMFSVDCDTLLKGGNKFPGKKDKKVGRYFGTDGFRGESNRSLTAEHAYKIGRFLGWYFAGGLSGREGQGYRPKIVIGKDTRRSSYMLEYALVAGITASGADAYMLHVITTPGVAFVTRNDGFDCGVMISASHNPFYDNGIKILNSNGEKISDEFTALIEDYLDGDLASLSLLSDIPLATGDKIGSIIDHAAGRNRYVGYLISLASNSYKHLRIGLDTANGASWNIARSVFSALGANVYLIGAEPNGTNINEGCGSTHIERLSSYVRENKLDLGFAFDGDADRCIAVDENGNTVNGDHIIYILAKRLKGRGMLDKDTAVATIMSNVGLNKALEKEGITCVRTTVGDRYVYECMQKNNYRVGGEQSGHIILSKYATTGDGILTAIMLTEEVVDKKLSLAALCEGMTMFPQKTVNVRVKNKDEVMGDSIIEAARKEIEEKIGDSGRILLRKSGTEPVIRVMAECATLAECEKYVNRLSEMIKEKYGV